MTSSYGGTAPIMLGISWAEAVVATILVLLRAYSARSHSDQIRWDFIWVAVACAAGLVIQGLLVVATIRGVGNHLIHIKLEGLWYGLKMTWMGLILGLVAAAAAKLSIIALLLQVTTKMQPIRRGLLWSVAVFICLVNIAQAAVSLTQCDPANKLWNKLEPGSCPRATFANNFGIFQGSVAVASDFFLALYPTTVVWDLKISRRAKFGFCGLMAGGLLPAVAGLMRTIYIQRLVVATDATYELSPFLTWALTEVWFIIILGSVPPLRPLFERVFRRAKAMTNTSGGTRTGATDLEATGKGTTKNGGDTVATLRGNRSSNGVALTGQDHDDLLAGEEDEKAGMGAGVTKTSELVVTVMAADESLVAEQAEDHQEVDKFGDRRADE